MGKPFLLQWQALLTFSPYDPHVTLKQSVFIHPVRMLLPTMGIRNQRKIAIDGLNKCWLLSQPSYRFIKNLLGSTARHVELLGECGIDPLCSLFAVQGKSLPDGEAFLMAPEPPPDRRKERYERTERKDRPERPRGAKPFTTYRIDVGKRHRIGPGAIVGAIANEGGLHRSDFGHIAIGPDFSHVELPAKLPKAALKKLENTRISGVLINLRPERSPGKPRRKHTG